MPGGRPLKWATVEDLKRDIDTYFETCDDIDRPYTYQGLANILNIDRKTLLNYSNKEEYFPAIKNARARIHEYIEELLVKEGKAGQIFYSKNNMDYVDASKQETVDVTARDAFAKALKDAQE